MQPSDKIDSVLVCIFVVGFIVISLVAYFGIQSENKRKKEEELKRQEVLLRQQEESERARRQEENDQLARERAGSERLKRVQNQIQAVRQEVSSLRKLITTQYPYITSNNDSWLSKEIKQIVGSLSDCLSESEITELLTIKYIDYRTDLSRYEDYVGQAKKIVDRMKLLLTHELKVGPEARAKLRHQAWLHYLSIAQTIGHTFTDEDLKTYVESRMGDQIHSRDVELAREDLRIRLEKLASRERLLAYYQENEPVIGKRFRRDTLDYYLNDQMNDGRLLEQVQTAEEELQGKLRDLCNQMYPVREAELKREAEQRSQIEAERLRQERLSAEIEEIKRRGKAAGAPSEVIEETIRQARRKAQNSSSGVSDLPPSSEH